ncbi:NUDIX hydrolase [Acinetobacter sp. DSM 11652]|uniref:NUDIX hydrolase n=1 Tax=Acinetobacter sp. DSM 11652 TaxID=346222 RepID=UPI0008C9E29F|nr:NUDIX domain-containing protein [Acinetobacter sp. DSM 11652]SEM00370.1 ADP-ribose pyrophosphatase YjhB, NUDIX family [Acinetobacter sp. DSM 11652]
MGFYDFYRLSSHAVITNPEGQVLLLKANYANYSWGLPGGGLDQGETIHQALLRECKEEIGCDVSIQYLSGVYYHAHVNSHTFIFRCMIENNAQIQLSEEHTEYAWYSLEQLSEVQRTRVQDCLNFQGEVRSYSF